MDFHLEFAESEQSFELDFEEVQTASDGGYEQGYEAGLAARRYETWTITLSDGNVIEKEVALL